MYYFYDGTFMGLLSLVYAVFLDKNFDIFILKEGTNTIFEGKHIKTSQEKAGKVYAKLEKILGKLILEKIHEAFLSEEDGIELTIICYIKLAFKYGKEVEKHYCFETKKIDDLSKKVCHEAHKFKGFLRFRKLKDETYFAVIKPDYDILSLISEHFTDRFNDQTFVVYDENRKKALLFDSHLKQHKTVQVPQLDMRLKDMKNSDLLHREELDYTGLWKGYFNSIAIEDRENSRLQKSHMPLKYRENLVETD